MPGQIWQDLCYYLDKNTGECKRKYVLVLAVDPKGSGDLLTAVFTSKSHGLTESPACSVGPPRTGFYVGVPGGILTKPTWVDFSSLLTLDEMDLRNLIESQRRKLLSQRLDAAGICSVLRCVLKCDDITKRQTAWVWQAIGDLTCS